MQHIQILTNSKILNDTTVGICLVNEKVKLMGQTVSPNWMALDLLTEAQGSICAIVKLNVMCICVIYPPNISMDTQNVG